MFRLNTKSRADIENFWSEIANESKPNESLIENDVPSQPKVIIMDSLDDSSLGVPVRRRPSEFRNVCLNLNFSQFIFYIWIFFPIVV